MAESTFSVTPLPQKGDNSSDAMNNEKTALQPPLVETSPATVHPTRRRFPSGARAGPCRDHLITPRKICFSFVQWISFNMPWIAFTTAFCMFVFLRFTILA